MYNCLMLEQAYLCRHADAITVTDYNSIMHGFQALGAHILRQTTHVSVITMKQDND